MREEPVPWGPSLPGRSLTEGHIRPATKGQSLSLVAETVFCRCPLRPKGGREKGPLSCQPLGAAPPASVSGPFTKLPSGTPPIPSSVSLCPFSPELIGQRKATQERAGRGPVPFASYKMGGSCRAGAGPGLRAGSAVCTWGQSWHTTPGGPDSPAPPSAVAACLGPVGWGSCGGTPLTEVFLFVEGAPPQSPLAFVGHRASLGWLTGILSLGQEEARLRRDRRDSCLELCLHCSSSSHIHGQEAETSK